MSIPSVTTLASWASTAAILIGAYWYMEDLRREVGHTLEAQHQAFEAEADRDEQWKADETSDFDDVRLGIKGVDEKLDSMVVALATANDDLNYRMGLHVGDHTRLQDLLTLTDAQANICKWEAR